MMGRATRPVVPPIRKLKLDRVYAQPWGPLYPVNGSRLASPSGPKSATKRHHSITSSAVARSDGGMVRPSALAVLRLITSANLVS
jgi:hypothetical protein